jgi:WD40 repeat protein
MIGFVTALTLTPTGFASGSFDHTIRLWNFTATRSADGKLQTAVSCAHVLRGHVDGIWSLKYLAIPLNPVLLSGSSDATMRIWSIRPEAMGCVRVLEGHQSDVYAIDAAVCQNKVAPYLRDLSALEDNIAKDTQPNYENTVTTTTSIAILTGSADETLRIWRKTYKSTARWAHKDILAAIHKGEVTMEKKTR